MSTFFFAILILAVISCVIDYSEKVDNIVQKKAPLLVVLNYYKNFVPHITALLFPLFIFISTIFFTSKMAYKTEVIAILSSGVSYRRFLRPYFIGGGFLCAVSLVANHWVIPMADKQRIAFEDKYINDGNFVAAGQNVHLGLAKDKFIYIQNFNFTNNIGTHFAADSFSGTLLKQKVMAETASYDTVKKSWHLHGVMIRSNDSLSEVLVKVADTNIKYPFLPADMNRTDAIKEALTTPELDAFTEKERLRGRENLNFYYVERERRTAQPFAGLILTLIGASIASRKIRGGSGFHLALGIAISAIYIMFLQFSTTLSTKSSLDPTVAVWIPNVIFAGVAYYLYWRQIK